MRTDQVLEGLLARTKDTEMFGEKGAGQAFGLNIWKQMYDRWASTTSQALEEMMKMPAFAASLGHVLTQSMNFKRQTDETWEIWLRSMRFATTSDVEAILTEVKTGESQVTQIASSIGAVDTDLGKAIEQFRQRDEALWVSFEGLQRALESEMKTVVTELRINHSKLTQTMASVEDMMGRLTTVERNLNQILERSSQK